MNITLSQKQLLPILRDLAPITKSAYIRSLQYILVEVRGTFVYFTATDGSIRVTRRITSPSTEDSSLLFPAQRFLEAVKQLKGQIVITDTGVSDATQSVTLDTMGDNEYPLPPKMGGISVMSEGLGRVIGRIARFMPNKNDNTQLNYVQMVFKDDILTVAGGNSVAMLREELPLEGQLHHTYWIPSHFAKLLPDGKVIIEIAGGTISVSDFDGNQWFSVGNPTTGPNWASINAGSEFMVDFQTAPQYPTKAEWYHISSLVYITCVDGGMQVVCGDMKSQIPAQYNQPFPPLIMRPQDWTAAMKIGSPVRMSWKTPRPDFGATARLDIDGSTVYILAKVQ